MIILPNKSKPLKHSNRTSASSAWAPTPATKSLAIFGVHSLLLGFGSVIVSCIYKVWRKINYLNYTIMTYEI